MPKSIDEKRINELYNGLYEGSFAFFKHKNSDYDYELKKEFHQQGQEYSNNRASFSDSNNRNGGNDDKKTDDHPLIEKVVNVVNIVKQRRKKSNNEQ